MSSVANRALVVLAAFDYEALQVTLQSLEHTIDPTEKVVVILNGKKTSASERTERTARIWAARNPVSRFVVRPLCSGGAPYFAVTEILKHYEPLKDVQHICKIDDDLVPLKRGWLPHLADVYTELSKNRNIGFVTGLINNNGWGFSELLPLFEKEQEYAHMFNYTSLAGAQYERRVSPGKIDIDFSGTVLTYPFLGWWIHQWTTKNIPEFISKTSGLPLKQIPAPIHYSIGCIYFDKALWLSMDPQKCQSTFDELILHKYCQEEKKEKWAVMDQPMVHLCYRTQRLGNQDLVQELLPAFAQHFNDEMFKTIKPLLVEDRFFEDRLSYMENILEQLKNQIAYIHKKASVFSFVKRWKEKREQKKLNQNQL